MKTGWLGFSILLSAILLSGSIIFAALMGRYETEVSESDTSRIILRSDSFSGKVERFVRDDGWLILE